MRMNVDEAARRLKAMYEKASEGDKAVSIHLFGIECAEELKDLPLNEIVIRAGVPDSYRTEIRKGIRLAQYVTLKR